MQEILSGVFHWTTFHEGIKYDIDSYYIEATEPAVVIDPRVPAEGLDWFEEHAKPAHAILTNRHHYRHCAEFEKAFGTKVWCHEEGLHEFTEGEQVMAFRHGDELPGGILALKVGVLCPEETALLIPVGDGVLAIGDAVIRYNETLGFVPDQYMGDDPEGIKRGMRDALLGIIDGYRFDSLLFAHGTPLVGEAQSQLRDFLEGVQA
jgi:hypothetical protein